jgi:hypothetical protein|tara:strand:+ start:219 stop:401 length:183 start_codon:yes stop_codon:yes gene_type:complete
MTVKVYFETHEHGPVMSRKAKIVAIFDDEDTYNVCEPALEKWAADQSMFVTASVEEKEAL